MKKLTFISFFLVFIALSGYSQEKQEKQKPKAVYQVGKSKVVVWENKRQGKNGEFIAKRFEVENSYKKGDEWKTTNQFNEKELLDLKEAIDKAISEEKVVKKEIEEDEKK